MPVLLLVILMSVCQPAFDVSAARAAFLADSGSAGGTFEADDGASLFYRLWRVRDGRQPMRVAVFLHGIGNHSRAYADFTRYIAASGTLVYGLDLRGHGLSDGPRGTMDYGRVINDIIGFFGFVRRAHPGERYIMIGESMGAAFALRYAAMRNDSLSALVLVAPALTASDETVWDISSLAVMTHLQDWRCPRLSHPMRSGRVRQSGTSPVLP
jgi:alpha-beta hydrolase superfamily lysophospholipase